MKKQKIYTLTVCMLGLIALAGSTLTFAGGASSRSSANDQLPDIFEEEKFYKIVLKNGKYKFANFELKKKNNLSESDWMVHAWKLGMTITELNKIKNKHYTAREIVLGTLIFNYYKSTLADNAYSDEDRLLMLKQAADHGSEYAITALLRAYTEGKLGLKSNDTKVQQEKYELARKYAKKGSNSKHITATLIEYCGN